MFKVNKKLIAYSSRICP